MADGPLTNRYNYRLVRLWTEDPEPDLSGGVSLVPMAPLANVADEALPGLMQRMAGRINAEPEPRATKLWAAVTDQACTRRENPRLGVLAGHEMIRECSRIVFKPLPEGAGGRV